MPNVNIKITFKKPSSILSLEANEVIRFETHEKLEQSDIFTKNDKTKTAGISGNWYQKAIVINTSEPLLVK